jgi:hydroxymethylpyrimidine/phosphomethylpyrimidine kinase
MIPNVLSIAGVDPSGGAGLLADVKTFSALGAYGCGVVTALTAQNTRAVTGIHAVPPDFVAAQLDTLFADVRIDAIKIGMLATPALVIAVAGRLATHGATRIVLDPVMVAKSGDRLLAAEAVAALRELLLPMAEVATPNLPEAAVLLDDPRPAAREAMRATARRLRALGPRIVLLKGGHLEGPDSTDVADDGTRVVELAAPRIVTRNTHGTGCTLSSAIAALLPQRDDAFAAIRDAKDYVTRAIAASGALAVGAGHGPVHHFHSFGP